MSGIAGSIKLGTSFVIPTQAAIFFFVMKHIFTQTCSEVSMHVEDQIVPTAA
jgi:hypothetical protein